MAFWDDVGNFFGGIFGGTPKKKEDEKPVQQPITISAPKPQGISIAPSKPTVVPLINQPTNPNVVPLVNTKPKPQATVVKPKSFLDNLADFGNDTAKNLGNFGNDVAKNVGDFSKTVGDGINDYNTNPNNTARNVADYIFGIDNPLDGATLDYQNKVDGKPTLVPRAKPTNVQEYASRSLGGDIINELLIKPTVQAAPRLYDTIMGQDATALPQWVQDANKGLGYNNEDLNSAYKPDADGTMHPVLGTVETVGDAATLIPVVGGLIKGFTKGVSKTSRAVNDIFRGIRSTDEAAEDTALSSRALGEADEALTTKRPGEPATVETPTSGDPITTSPTTNKAPAITSPNFDTPSVVAPKPFFPEAAAPTGAPQLGGIPKIEAPVAPATIKPISNADEATAAAQKAIDDATVNPPEVTPTEISSAPAESPVTAASREVPVNNVDAEAIAQASAAKAANQAPTEAIGREIPEYSSPKRGGKASVGGTSKASYTTGDPNLDGIVNDAIIAHKGTAGTAEARAAALDKAGIDSAQREAIRNVAVKNVDKQTGKITPEGQSQIEAIIRGETPVKPVSSTVQDAAAVSENAASDTSELGSISRKAVEDGSIRTPEGIDAVENAVEAAATKAATDNGTDLATIIKKGQRAWEKSKGGKELTDAEAGLTKEQADIYRNLSQEIGTLRDRIDPSLRTGGDQGRWYLPRQAVDELGDSQAYDSRLVNEISRDKTPGGGVAADELDTSIVPIRQAIRRYSNGADGLTQKFTSTVEDTAGIKVPEPVKADLNKTLRTAIDARDDAKAAAAAGDDAAILEANKAANDAFDKAIVDFADNLPGSGKARQEAINALKAERDTFIQSSTQTLSLSNIVNRTADHIQKATEVWKNAALPAISKVSGKLAGIKAPEESLLRSSKEAREAARNVSRGTLSADTAANLKSSVRLAGIGRNPIVKGIAKIDAGFRAGGTALTSSADLLTQNTRLAHLLSLSRPEAQGLKTTAEFEKFMRANQGSAAFKEDLRVAESINNPHVGLAGGRSEQIGNGKISSFLSKNIDNGISNALKDSKVPQRLVQEVNDYVKSRITGYSGVASRVFGTGMNAILGGVPRMRAAAELAASGAPNAVAQAQAMAAHSVLDVLSLYGTAGLTAMLASNNVLGYTGSQPEAGSSEAARFKKDNIPAGTFFINLPGGKPLYFQPARALGMDGVVANIVAGVATGDGNVGDNIRESFAQMADNLGGSSLISTLSNAYDFLGSSSESTRDYASQQLQRTAVPGLGILNNIANWGDVYKRDPKGFAQIAASQIPGARESVPIATDTSGNPIKNSKQVSGGSSLFSIGEEGSQQANAKTDDPINDEVRRLAQLTGADGKKLEVTPTGSNTNATIKKNADFAKDLLNDPIYKAADDETKAGYLKDILAGTTTKDINPSVSAEGRKALIDAKLLGDKKEAWLDDNTNNAAYQTGMYDNAKANGTLTEADKDITNPKGLRYKSIAATVDKEVGADYALKNQYGDISQSEFKKMLDPESDEFDADAAQKLYDYDQARVKAGLPPKYDLKKAQAGSGKGSKNFAFASLPSSLVGTKSSSGSGDSGYAKDAPLFKPIADLSARPTVAIPTGRSISVKQGVQL